MHVIGEVKGKNWFTTFLPKGNYSNIRKLFMKAIIPQFIEAGIEKAMGASGEKAKIKNGAWLDNFRHSYYPLPRPPFPKNE